MTISIAPSKVKEAADLCKHFLQLPHIDTRSMQSFMGKVLHSTKCTTATRRFTNRLLDLLRIIPPHTHVRIPQPARLDALWLATFLQAFNGVTLIKHHRSTHGLRGRMPGGPRRSLPLPGVLRVRAATLLPGSAFQYLFHRMF